MRNRVKKMMVNGPSRSAGCKISTFHSFCLRICRNFGQNKNFNVFGARQCVNVMAEAMAEISGDDSGRESGSNGNNDAASQRAALEKDIKAHAQRVQSVFSVEKSRLGGVDALMEHASLGKIYRRYREPHQVNLPRYHVQDYRIVLHKSEKRREFLQMTFAYFDTEYKMSQYGAYDFNDLIINALNILARPEVRRPLVPMSFFCDNDLLEEEAQVQCCSWLVFGLLLTLI